MNQAALILLRNFYAIVGFESQLSPRSRMITSNSSGSSRPSAKKIMKRMMFMQAMCDASVQMYRETRYIARVMRCVKRAGRLSL
jgi:hypothetical protein